ncbi:Na+/H+ antiporter [Caballeronia ptereochthonis]|uniref:Sodium/hydrogen exchanger n=1 Tax=Caballeronia ptereochthonis TaxID=1777144 RepID=A0A158DAN8_9BURK|nr:Na+/H+ antiporter [Caballeronia ptereochthonis]SAK91551.1 sodium/hydrogen exchanger [Caballeronia ptereochthonis]
MNNVELFHYILLLVCGAGVLTWIAERMAVPPAVVLLFGGVAIALMGRNTTVDMDPNLVLTAVLPPLLMSSAFYTAWSDFRREIFSILSLVLGAVAFTTVAVAVTVHAFAPALAWPACFALGAIVSPPDAVAAKAILDRNPLPSRLVTVLEGESLVNDATGLLLYQMSIAAAFTGQFTAGRATGVFLMLTIVGIAVGIACGQLMMWLIKHVTDPMLRIVLTFLMAWASYSVAEELGGSGVLSVVTCGLMLGVRQHRAFDALTRVKAAAAWEVIVFVLDALVFILIGLALHGIVVRMGDTSSMLATSASVALPALVAVILSRLVWVVVAIYLPSRVGSGHRNAGRRWQPGEIAVLAWAGVRGVVSLAAALALPEQFPNRDAIVFSTFLVIFGTLVIQGGSLAVLIRLIGLRAVRGSTMSELEARSHTFRAALTELEKISQAVKDEDRSPVRQLIDEYQMRVRNNEKAHSAGKEHIELRARHLRLELDLVTISRQTLLRLHREGKIEDSVLHRLEAELDLEELRLHRLLEP